MMHMDKLCDEFSEKELVGGVLVDHDSYTNTHGQLQPEHFSNFELGAIYRAVGENYCSGNPTDLMTLATKAGVRPERLVSLMGDTYLGALRSTAERIVALSQKRDIARKLAAISATLAESSIEDLTGRLTEIAVSVSLDCGTKRLFNAESMVERVKELQESRKKEPGMIRGILTGYIALDVTLRGLRPRRITMLVAATGFGKSTMAINMLINSVRAGVKTLLISTENDIDDNLDRLCGVASGVELKEIEGGYRPEHVAESFARHFKGKTAFISDNSPRNIHEVIGTIARYVLQHGVELVFVDYIGEIALDNVKNENEEARLTRYSQALLEASRTLGCHIVVLAQLNRDGNRKGRPGKTELQGCFKMAQKAHALLIFWQNEDGLDILTVDKNRQGPAKVDIAMQFQRTTQKISELGFYIEDGKRIIPPGKPIMREVLDLDAEELPL